MEVTTKTKIRTSTKVALITLAVFGVAAVAAFGFSNFYKHGKCIQNGKTSPTKTDCCSKFRIGLTCANCIPNGQVAPNKLACCSGYHNDSGDKKCAEKPKCRANGQEASNASDCCSKYLASGKKCAEMPKCFPNGTVTSKSELCCSKYRGSNSKCAAPCIPNGQFAAESSACCSKYHNDSTDKKCANQPIPDGDPGN